MFCWYLGQAFCKPDEPKSTDKYPSLNISGYIYSVEGEPLTSPPSIESVTQRLLRRNKWICSPQGANTIVTGRYNPLDLYTTAQPWHNTSMHLFIYNYSSPTSSCGLLFVNIISFIVRQQRIVCHSSTSYRLLLVNIISFTVLQQCIVYRSSTWYHLLFFNDVSCIVLQYHIIYLSSTLYRLSFFNFASFIVLQHCIIYRQSLIQMVYYFA